MINKNQHHHPSESGAFIFLFVLLIIVILPLICFLINFAQVRLIDLRMDRVLSSLAPDQELNLLLAPPDLGVVKTQLTDKNLTVEFEPFMPTLNKTQLLTKAFIPPVPVQKMHLVVALDVFLPEPQGSLIDQYQTLFDQLKQLVAEGHEVTLIPYAASINLGVMTSMIFPEVPVPSREEIQFARLSPKYAMLNNRQGTLALGQTPQKDVWQGCISVKKRCDFSELSPFFVPSSFGQRRVLQQAEYEAGYLVTGPNNWTPQTIRDRPEDYVTWGGFVQGPNIGCPQKILKNCKDPVAFQTYVAGLTAIKRGGSVWELALDYAHHVVRDIRGPRMIVLTKITPIRDYLWPGPPMSQVTADTGYPRGVTPDVQGILGDVEDYRAGVLGALGDFKHRGGKVVLAIQDDKTLACVKDLAALADQVMNFTGHAELVSASRKWILK